MLKLLGRIERFDARGNKRMLPHVTFRVKRSLYDYTGESLSFVWIGPNDPTPAQWHQMAQDHIYPQLEREFGKAPADELLRNLDYPHATPVA